MGLGLGLAKPKPKPKPKPEPKPKPKPQPNPDQLREFQRGHSVQEQAAASRAIMEALSGPFPPVFKKFAGQPWAPSSLAYCTTLILGFLVGENFHPMWGGNLDLPSVIAFQETPLQDFIPGLAVLFFIHEFGSIFTFNSPFGGELWSIRSDYASGNLGWDPLGLKPTNPSELKAMQTKEINNGRLAMIGIVGMIGQELATGNKLF